MDNLLQVTPFLHVGDLDKAVRFFVEALGFIALYRDDSYAYVHREAVAFRLLLQSPDDPTPPRLGGFAYYVDVRDVDAMLAEIRPRLDGWPDVNLIGPIDQSYGQREIMLYAPDNRVLVFGQALPPPIGA